MPKSANQKLKLPYLMRYLLENSDEKHPVSVKDMISELERYGITAERKSIYDDIESLRQFGLDVIQVRGRSAGYYVGMRDFDLAELKLLVDSVQSSRFITEKKSDALIRKIEGLASRHDAQLLQRQVFVRGRVKSMNENILYIVDELSAAITQDRAIRFHYFDFTVSKERHLRNGGDFYEVSPFSLMWDDENYYLLGWEDKSAQLKHFRVDKMTDIAMLDRPRTGKAAFAEIDMSAYDAMIFGMFRGEEQSVVLRFADHLAGAVLDRFGSDVMLVPETDGCFTVRVKVAVSPQFFAWLFGFGSEVEILSPESVRRQMLESAAQVVAAYGGKEENK